MANLQRVNLMLDPQQRENLERLAKQKKRSVSELVREYIAIGLHQEDKQRRERQQALKNARLLKERILKRRKGQPIGSITEIFEQIREERSNELLGH